VAGVGWVWRIEDFRITIVRPVVPIFFCAPAWGVVSCQVKWEGDLGGYIRR